MTIVFATNDHLDFPGTVRITDAARFRSAYVSQAFQTDGAGITYGNAGFTQIPQVSGDVTWIHFQYAKATSFGGSSSDGNAVLHLSSVDGTAILDFDMLDGSIRIRLFGSSTLTVNLGGNLTGTSPKAIDLKIDLTSDISVECFVDGISQYDESQAWTSSPGNPGLIWWRTRDANDAVSLFQQVSELIIADENTVGMGLSEMTPNAAGNYSAWQGDHVETGDNDLGTGASVDTTAQKLSSVLSTFGGPSSSALRAVVVNTKASTRGGTVNDLRNFLRINSSDYNGAALGVDDGVKGHTYVWDVNPDTSNDWDTTDFSGVEVGVESLA